MDQSHYDLIKKSILEKNNCKSWNKWRIQNPNISPNLSYANLISADLSSANLKDADLSYADLYYANLRYANLFSADLSFVNLSYANLSYANLISANLRFANLISADLSYANLKDADLSYANLENTKLSYQICPEQGEFIAWKVAKTENNSPIILKLKIPQNSKRISSISSRKCRSDKAIILQIYDIKGKIFKNKDKIVSIHNKDFQYLKGKSIKSDSFDPDPRIDCSHGIHFFISKQEAIDWAKENV